MPLARGNEAITPDLFLDISADIAYRLSGAAFDPRALLDIILLGLPSDSIEESILVQALSAVHAGYGDHHRRLGPLAVIHPIRTAAILVRVTHDPCLRNLLVALLHDRDEDLTEDRIGPARWKAMQRELKLLDDMLDSETRMAIEERVTLLTRHEDQPYPTYLTEMMAQGDMVDLIRVKMADRLDNTLDIGVRRHGVPDQGVFGVVFDTLFLPGYEGLRPPYRYVPMLKAEGVQVLANLFKNAQFISLFRFAGYTASGPTAQLCDALTLASLRIAKFLVQDAFVSLDVHEQRRAVHVVKDYCMQGGLDAVRKADGDESLDGLFLDQYGDKEGRKNRLKEIFDNRPLLARVGLVFLAVFSNFYNNPHFYIEGIDADGIWAAD